MHSQVGLQAPYIRGVVQPPPPPAAEAQTHSKVVPECPFGPDCPSFLALQGVTRQLRLALQSNDVLRQAHDEAIERFTEITTRLSAETTALANAHDFNEDALREAQRKLQISTANEAQLTRALYECAAERDQLSADVNLLTNAAASLSERVEMMADALDKLSSQHEAARLRIRFLEERCEAQVREGRQRDIAGVPESSPASTLRPMIDMVNQLETLRGKPPSYTGGLVHQSYASRPTRELSESPGKDAAATLAAARLGSTAELISASVASTVDELSRHARDLAELCVEKPELQRMLKQLREVQHKNAELKASLSAAESSLRAETLVAEAKAKAQEVYWERKAKEAHQHADEWKRLAEAAASTPHAPAPTVPVLSSSSTP